MPHRMGHETISDITSRATAVIAPCAPSQMFNVVTSRLMPRHTKAPILANTKAYKPVVNATRHKITSIFGFKVDIRRMLRC